MNILEYLLEKYPDKPWDWREISCNPNITMEIIEKYPHKIIYILCNFNFYFNLNLTICIKIIYILIYKYINNYIIL